MLMILDGLESSNVRSIEPADKGQALVQDSHSNRTVALVDIELLVPASKKTGDLRLEGNHQGEPSLEIGYL